MALKRADIVKVLLTNTAGMGWSRSFSVECLLEVLEGEVELIVATVLDVVNDGHSSVSVRGYVSNQVG